MKRKQRHQRFFVIKKIRFFTLRGEPTPGFSIYVNTYRTREEVEEAEQCKIIGKTVAIREPEGWDVVTTTIKSKYDEAQIISYQKKKQ